MKLQDSTGASPLATEPIGKLLLKFALPSTMGFLITALYNITDQIFIGHKVGMLGNAATNVAFPLSTLIAALALMIGVGSASNFNLCMGAGQRERAGHMAGSGLTLLMVSGVGMGAAVFTFLDPLLLLFGATGEVLPLAQTYTRITAIGIPFVLASTGMSPLIRADGSPTYSMLCILSGAVINVALDALFMLVFGMGMAGAALATVLGQAAAYALAVRYMFHFKTLRLTKHYLIPAADYAKAIASLGMASCVGQLAAAVVHIVMNHVLTHYGALSRYGSAIPLACVGVINKVSVVFSAFIGGISQGCQPIFGYNYGAKHYARVGATYRTAAKWVTVISVISFAAFQCFPRQIIGIFGAESELYLQFAERCFRIFMALAFINGLQPLTANFFTSIGKSGIGAFISLTRQVLFLLPLLVILPIYFGIDGAMYAGPLSDGVAAVLTLALVARELRNLDNKIETAVVPTTRTTK